jgi:cytochrome b pre-mRNA-processing protein 3
MWPKFSLKRKNNTDEAAGFIYPLIIAAARAPAFYEKAAVPDTIDGRFELIVLHQFFLINRLNEIGITRESGDLKQALFDIMFNDMDLSLREMGVGDLGVPRRMRAMMEAFNGRVHTYDEAVQGNDEDLAVALKRNLYGTVKDIGDDKVAKLVEYIRAQVTHLEQYTLAQLMMADFAFKEFAI